MNGDLALHRSSCPSAGRFDHRTGSGWQAHPRFKMFMAALISRSMIRPQPGQLCTLTLRSFFTTRPHPEHICDVPLGSTSMISRRALAATSAILVRILPMEASLYWFVILLERDLDLSCSTLRSSNRVGSDGLSHRLPSHTTVRAGRHTAVGPPFLNRFPIVHEEEHALFLQP